MSDYKTFKRQLAHIRDYPQLLKIVDAQNGIIYINVDAVSGANVVLLLPP